MKNIFSLVALLITTSLFGQHIVKKLVWNEKSFQVTDFYEKDSLFFIPTNTIDSSLMLKELVVAVTQRNETETEFTFIDTVSKSEINGVSVYLIRDSAMVVEEYVEIPTINLDEGAHSEEEEEVEESYVGDPDRPMREKMYVPVIKYYWVGKAKKSNLWYSCVANVDYDPSLMENQKQFIAKLIDEVKFVGYDALKYYTENEIQTEQSPFTLAKKTLEAIVNKDTLALYNRIGNLNDFNFLANKIVEAKPSERSRVASQTKSFSRSFIKTYYKISRFDLGIPKKDQLEDYIYNIEVKTKFKYVLGYRISVFIKTSEFEEAKVLKLEALKTDRGFVLIGRPRIARKSSRFSKEMNNVSESLISFRLSNQQFEKQPLFKLINEFSEQIKSWEIAKETIKLNLNNGSALMVELTSKTAEQDLSKLEKKLVSKVRFKGSEVRYTPQNKAELVNGLYFCEEALDQALLRNGEWFPNQFIDSSEYITLVASLDSLTQERFSYAKLKKNQLKSEKLAYSNEKGYNRTLVKIDSKEGKAYYKYKEYENGITIHPKLYTCKNYECIGIDSEGLYYSADDKAYKLVSRPNAIYNASGFQKVYFNTQKTDTLYHDNELKKLSAVLEKMHKDDLMWTYNYKAGKLKSITFSYVEPTARVVVIVKVKQVPKAFYNNEPLYRRLNQLEQATVTHVEIRKRPLELK